MKETDPLLQALTETQRQELEALLVAFEQSWHGDRLREVVQALPSEPNPLRRPALVELMKIDLERQWQAGRGRRVEEYLRDFPELGSAATVTPDLVRAEYEARAGTGDTAELAHYVERFPHLAPQLRELLQRTIGSPPPRPADATPAPPPKKKRVRRPAVELPEQFGRYRILKKLGQGGMGAVYLAHDTQLDRQVALKVPHVHPDDGPQVLDRFLIEARAAATLNHPNNCPVYDVNEIDGQPYLTMAFVEGRPLSDFLVPGKPVSPAAAVGVVRKIALALDEAHRRGVVHRDLKPANILVNQRREPVVMDFGLARRLDQADPRLTRSGTVVGTPAYMAPEQVSGGAIGPACDQYSLGVILYEPLTGRLPFQGPVMAVLAMIQTQTPEPPSRHRPDLDAGLEAVVLKAMARDPADRYPSMRAFADALGKHLGGTTAVVPKPRVTRQVPKPAAKTQVSTPPAPPRRRLPSVPLMAAGAGLAVMFLLGVVLLFRTHEGVVRVEVDDENLRVAIDGRDIDIANGPVPLPVGEHRLSVRLGDATLRLGQSVKVKAEDRKLVFRFGDAELRGEKFTVVRGDNPVLRISLLPAASKSPATGAAFVPLFNGQDLTGWIADGGPLADWRVADGVLVGSGPADGSGRGWLLSEHAYEDFTLRGEFQADPAAFGGVALRAVPGETDNDGRPFHTQVRLGDDPRPGASGKTGTLFWSRLHELPATLPSVLGKPPALKPPGAWNELEITLRGQSLQVKVNGALATQDDLNERSQSATASPGTRRVRGRVGLRQPAGAMRFRKLAIQELPASRPPREPGWVPLFNGTDLTGWKTHPANPGAWNVEGGILSGGGGQHSCLFTKRGDFKNVHLRFEARLGPRGNAEVGVRAPFGTAERRGPDRFALPGGLWSVLSNDPARFWRTGTLHCPLVGRPGETVAVVKDLLTPAGTWFTQELVVDTHSLASCVNGRLVGKLPIAGGSAPHPPGHIVLQYDPSTQVEFRKIEARELDDVKVPSVRPLPPPATPAKPLSAAWTPLFNGTDLTGWKTHPHLPDGWGVEDGALVGKAKIGYLYSEFGDFEDFHLRAECTVDGNAGIFFRAPFEMRQGALPFGMNEVDLVSTKAGPDAPGNILRPGDAVIPATGRRYGPNESFVIEVIAIGKRITVKVDGAVVATTDDGNGRYPRGHLMLQVLGSAAGPSVVRFHKMEVRAPSAAPQPADP